jgi:hypothetical protein|tara:strand:- start:1904 stop:2314 length:411 start_codon:yes stop_codon:yes gene_type:complete
MPAESRYTKKVHHAIKRASFEYHKDRDVRLDSVQISDLPFRLVLTSRNIDASFHNYLVSTPKEYSDFNYQDIREGRIIFLSKFSLSEIKNSKTRESFAKKMTEIIRTDTFKSNWTGKHFSEERLHGSRPPSLEAFF